MNIISTYIAYRMLKLLSNPFKEWDAYEYGLIDEKGEILREPENANERKSFGMFEKIILKIKKLFTSVMGHSRAAAILSTLYLMKEKDEFVYNEVLKKLTEDHSDIKEYVEEKMLLKEETVTGDVAQPDVCMSDMKRRRMRNPNLKGPYGAAAFSTKNENVMKILRGRKRNERWDRHLKDEGIKNWARKYPLKDFYIQQHGVFVKVR